MPRPESEVFLSASIRQLALLAQLRVGFGNGPPTCELTSKSFFESSLSAKAWP